MARAKRLHLIAPVYQFLDLLDRFRIVQSGGSICVITCPIDWILVHDNVMGSYIPTRAVSKPTCKRHSYGRPYVASTPTNTILVPRPATKVRATPQAKSACAAYPSL